MKPSCPNLKASLVSSALPSTYNLPLSMGGRRSLLIFSSRMPQRRRSPVSSRKRMSRGLLFLSPKQMGWQTSWLAILSRVSISVLSRQSHRQIRPDMSLVRMCFPVGDTRPIPFMSVRTQRVFPIRQGSPLSRKNWPSGKNSRPKAGGVMNCTFMGFPILRSCSSSKLEQDSTKGQIGCTATNSGVDQCPFKLTYLFVSRSCTVTSVWVHEAILFSKRQKSTTGALLYRGIVRLNLLWLRSNTAIYPSSYPANSQCWRFAIFISLRGFWFEEGKFRRKMKVGVRVGFGSSGYYSISNGNLKQLPSGGFGNFFIIHLRLHFNSLQQISRGEVMMALTSICQNHTCQHLHQH